MGGTICIQLPAENTQTDPRKNSRAQSISSTQTEERYQKHKKKNYKPYDYESVLSSPGQLEIPDKFKKWFPPRHGHENIRDLFKWHGELGHGVTGAVYEVEYKSQICALKRVQKNDQWGRMLFTTEARVLSKLRHCGIIGFIDMFFDDEYYYLALEKADFDLHSVMNKKGHLSERKTRNITYALLKAISYIHKKNLVHRDLKPENIVFIADNTDHPRLIDFGDAEMAKKDQLYTEFVGTPPYMSPERLAEHRGWQLKKSDIWAIAVIAFEMYTGKRCFDGDTQKQVFGRILNCQWSWPNDRKPPSDDMKDFINSCLSLNAEDRPTAKEALLHKWFDIKRKEESEEKNKLQARSRLNDTPSVAIEQEDTKTYTHTYKKSSVGSFLSTQDSTGIAIFEKLASMIENNPLQDILVKGYISTIKNDDLAPYQEQFDALDMDGDGFITGMDLVSAFCRNGIGPNEASSLASIIISELDVDRTGKISFRHFLEARLKYDLCSNDPKKMYDKIVTMSNSKLLSPQEKKNLNLNLQSGIQTQIPDGFESSRSDSDDNNTDLVYSDGSGNNNDNEFNNNNNNSRETVRLGISKDDIIYFSQSQTNLNIDANSLHEIFIKFDRDHDGKLTLHDFVEAVRSTRVVDAHVQIKNDLQIKCRVSVEDLDIQHNPKAFNIISDK